MLQAYGSGFEVWVQAYDLGFEFDAAGHGQLEP